MITPFGVMPDGKQVDAITLHSGKIGCRVITYGGAVQSLTVPDRGGNSVDVVLGFDDLSGYLKQDKYMGALIGRFANRIGGGGFPLGDGFVPLRPNEGENHLHGGAYGFDKQVWKIESVGEDYLTLSLVSPDGQEGYPGELRVEVSYTVRDNALEIDYLAKSDRDTVCSLTNHSYFNLSGHGSGRVEEQRILLNADFYTPTDARSIPTGELAPVDGTPMDLRGVTDIGKFADFGYEQLALAGGYDHNWAVRDYDGSLRSAALACSPRTGITLETYTTLPGIQFYSGNYLDGCPAGKNGAEYSARCGFCLETQFFPDSPNKPAFRSPILRAGEEYRHRTVYRFGVM